MDRNDGQLLGSGLLILAALIWGTAFVFQRVGMDVIEPITFNACRMALSAVAVGLVAFLAARRRAPDGPVRVQRRRATLAGGALSVDRHQIAQFTVSIGFVIMIHNNLAGDLSRNLGSRRLVASPVVAGNINANITFNSNVGIVLKDIAGERLFILIQLHTAMKGVVGNSGSIAQNVHCSAGMNRIAGKGFCAAENYNIRSVSNIEGIVDDLEVISCGFVVHGLCCCVEFAVFDRDITFAGENAAAPVRTTRFRPR